MDGFYSIGPAIIKRARTLAEPQFSVSGDEGETWSESRDYPITDHTNYTCMRHAPVEWSTDEWVCPFYDRTVLYDMVADQIRSFGDGRNHGMVPIVRTPKGTLISGAPQTVCARAGGCAGEYGQGTSFN